MKLTYEFSGYTLWLDVLDEDNSIRNVMDGMEAEHNTAHIQVRTCNGLQTPLVNWCEVGGGGVCVGRRSSDGVL